MKRIIFTIWFLFLGAVTFAGVIAWLSQTTSGARATIGIVNSIAPIDISYEKLSGTVSNLKLKNVAVKSNTLDTQVNQLSIDWNPFTGFLNKNIKIERLQAGGVFVKNQSTVSEKNTNHEKDFRLPFQLEIKSAEIDNLHFQSLHADAITHLSLSANYNQDQWLINAFKLEHPEITAETSGTLSPYGLFTHSLQSKFETRQSGKGTVSAIGDVKNTKLKLDITNPEIKIRGELLDWLTHDNIDFTATVDMPDFSGVSTKINISGKAGLNSGTIQLDGMIDKSVFDIDSLDYQREAENYNIVSRGEISNVPFNIKAGFSPKALEYSEFSWQAESLFDGVTIKNTTTHVSGPWNDLSIEHKGQGLINNIPTQLTLNAQLQNFEKLNIATSRVSTLEGQIDITGTANLKTPQVIKLNGQANDLNLAKFDSRLPILKNGKFVLGLTKANAGSLLKASFSDLAATVKDQRIDGNGHLQMTNKIINQASMNLTAGSNNQINLKLLDPVKQTLIVESDIGNLETLINDVQGSLSGKIIYDIKNSLFDGRVSMRNINVGDNLSIESVDLTAMPVSDQQSINVKGINLDVNKSKLKDFEFDISGTVENHRFNLNFSDLAERTVAASGNGQFINKILQVQIDTLDSNSDEFGRFKNQSLIDIEFSKNRFAIKPFCLDSKSAMLCGNLHKAGSIRGEFDLKIGANNSKFLNKHLGTVKLIPKADININTQFQIDESNITNLQLDGSLGQLAFYNNEDESLDMENISISISGKNDRIALKIGSEIAGGKIDINGNINGPTDAATIDAKITGNLPDLAKITPLLTSTDIQEGDLQIDLQVQGDLKTPRFSGNAAIKDTKLSIPELGITQTIDANIILTEDQKGEVTGTIISGEGNGKLNGTVKWVKEPIIDFNLIGKKLLIANNDNLTVSASPNLNLSYSPGELNINGNISIDRAYSTLVNSGVKTVLSKDAIIIDDPLAAADNETNQVRNIDITIEISNPVRIESQGVRGDVTGKLRITQKNSGPTLANGQLLINGQYQAFGQVLQIESGRLNYVNTSLDNPSIEIYASRQVGEVKVGARVTGKPDALVTRLESTPTMREADILNYLVLGKAPGDTSEAESNQLAQAALALALSRSESGIQSMGGRANLSDLSLSQELGGLALSLGKQLSPRLYISYTVGLAEPINIAKVRYMLNAKWVLESEFSDETRALLKYRIERD